MDEQNISPKIIPMENLCPECSREGSLLNEDSRGKILFCGNPTCRTLEFCDTQYTKFSITNKRNETTLKNFG